MIETHPLDLQPSNQSRPEFVQVLVDVDAKALDQKTFTYKVPQAFQENIQIGVPVSVPFGRTPKVTGFIVGLTTPPTDGFKVKEITELLDETPLFHLEYLQFLQWISEYYATPLTQVLSCAIPSNLIQQTRKEIGLNPDYNNPLAALKLSPLAQDIYTFLQLNPKTYTPKFLATQFKLGQKELSKAINELHQAHFITLHSSALGASRPKWVKQVICHPNRHEQTFTKRQQEILDFIENHGGTVLAKDLIEKMETTLPTLYKLQQEGGILINEVILHRNPASYFGLAGEAKKTSILSEGQAKAVQDIWNGPPANPYLLYGVTGSGKTEVYLTLTEKTLAEGKSTLVMVPEIALTSHIAKRFIERFGIDDLAIWHSNLSAGEKADTWRRIAAGELKIVIGARSAIFAPLQNIGLIVIDEEHDGSFKQDSPVPRYHAKTLALELCQRMSARMVIGSATPEVRSFYEAHASESLLYLPERFGGRSLAQVEIVDMKQERSHGTQGTFSRLMKAELARTIEAQEQAIILINRRGFYTIINCLQCDLTFMCPQCSVALTVHKAKRQVRCHYCGHEEEIPQFCPQCASMELVQTGTGSQRVEEELFTLFPEARILRLDSDIMQRKNAYQEIFNAFSQGGADILVGTQMVAKGLDIPNVTLVGVVSADASFQLPDYRSSERGFQLLTQVAGRSGRGDKPGKAVIQSINPSHPVIQYAKDQDYEGFYHYELMARQELSFPPFSQLFRLVVSCLDEERAKHFIKAATYNLKAILNKEGYQDKIEILGPAPCVISRIQGRYRFHCLIKNKMGEEGHRVITQFYKATTAPQEINYILDIDPQTLL